MFENDKKLSTTIVIILIFNANNVLIAYHLHVFICDSKRKVK